MVGVVAPKVVGHAVTPAKPNSSNSNNNIFAGGPDWQEKTSDLTSQIQPPATKPQAKEQG